MQHESSPSRGQRVLIILMGSLGDVVRGLSLVDAIKGGWADAHITWLVEPACEGIVRLHPRIDEVLTFQRNHGVRGIVRVVQELRRRTFDYTLDMQRHAKSGLFSRVSGAPVRIGFHPQDSKEGNSLWNNRFLPAFGESISKVEHYANFLDVLGVSRPERISFGLEGITLESVGTEWIGVLGRERYLGVVLGSSWDSKDWPVEGYEGVLDGVSDVGLSTVVLLGDRSKSAMAEQLERRARERGGVLRVCNAVGRTTLRELVALIRHAVVCIGPDSGPGHIAGAVGTPYISLFGPTPVVRNVPFGSEGLAISSQVGCSPCKRRVCPGLGKVCMKLIHPHAVLEKVGEVAASAR